jgi:hypothetical protein
VSSTLSPSSIVYYCVAVVVGSSPRQRRKGAAAKDCLTVCLWVVSVKSPQFNLACPVCEKRDTTTSPRQNHFVAAAAAATFATLPPTAITLSSPLRSVVKESSENRRQRRRPAPRHSFPPVVDILHPRSLYLEPQSPHHHSSSIVCVDDLGPTTTTLDPRSLGVGKPELSSDQIWGEWTDRVRSCFTNLRPIPGRLHPPSTSSSTYTLTSQPREPTT